jgi:hypothetical protein
MCILYYSTIKYEYYILCDDKRLIFYSKIQETYRVAEHWTGGEVAQAWAPHGPMISPQERPCGHELTSSSLKINESGSYRPNMFQNAPKTIKDYMCKPIFFRGVRGGGGPWWAALGPPHVHNSACPSHAAPSACTYMHTIILRTTMHSNICNTCCAQALQLIT